MNISLYDLIIGTIACTGLALWIFAQLLNAGPNKSFFWKKWGNGLFLCLCTYAVVRGIRLIYQYYKKSTQEIILEETLRIKGEDNPVLDMTLSAE